MNILWLPGSFNYVFIFVLEGKFILSIGYVDNGWILGL